MNDRQLNAGQNYFSDNYSKEIDEALYYFMEAFDIAYECGHAPFPDRHYTNRHFPNTVILTRHYTDRALYQQLM